MMTAPDPQETWPPRHPQCPVCCFQMPTPAHAFLHQQRHGEKDSWRDPGSLQSLPMALYDRVARLMQAYAESCATREEA